MRKGMVYWRFPGTNPALMLKDWINEGLYWHYLGWLVSVRVSVGRGLLIGV